MLAVKITFRNHGEKGLEPHSFDNVSEGFLIVDALLLHKASNDASSLVA